MEKEVQVQVNLSAPNLVNICVDQNEHDRLSGRLYHCYCEEALNFSDLIELLRILDNFFDAISFPQASTKTRSFVERETLPNRGKRPEKVKEQERVISYRGNLGTFITGIKFRQNSTWQGEIFCVETGEKHSFSNTLNFIKRIDQVLNYLEKR